VAGRGGAERGTAGQECPSQNPSTYLPPVAAANQRDILQESESSLLQNWP
jgi:hypothetical protein